MAVIDSIKMPDENEPRELRDDNTYTLLAPEYDSSITYNTGDYCIHEYGLYECNDDSVTSAWNAAKWTSITVAAMITELRAAMGGLSFHNGSPSGTADANTVYFIT